MSAISIVVVASIFIISILVVIIAALVVIARTKEDTKKLELQMKDIERASDQKFSKLSERMLKKEHRLWKELTNREMQILGKLLEGKGTKEISDVLFIAQGTVKNHQKKIYEKLNVHSVGELFVIVEEKVSEPENGSSAN